MEVNVPGGACQKGSIHNGILSFLDCNYGVRSLEADNVTSVRSRLGEGKLLGMCSLFIWR
jgi:hypothetical protein